jgi:hypothetical protein
VGIDFCRPRQRGGPSAAAARARSSPRLPRGPLPVRRGESYLSTTESTIIIEMIWWTGLAPRGLKFRLNEICSSAIVTETPEGPATCSSVGIRLPGKGSNFHGARPVHQIVLMIKWIRTSRLSMKKSFSVCRPLGQGPQPDKAHYEVMSPGHRR